MLKVIVTGATGMVGKGVLLECLDHPEVSEVLVIGRNALGMNHPKLNELLHADFTDFSSIKERLSGYDACYWCMGVSSVGMKEEKYRTLTYDFALALGRELVAINSTMTMIYVSGEGTDTTEQGRSMWARVKGKTENDLLNLGFKQAFMFRPGAIIPLRGITSRTKAYQFMYDYFMWFVKIMKRLLPNSIVNTTEMGLAMIHASRVGYGRQIVRPKDILVLAAQK